MGDLRSNIRDEILEKRMKEENKKNNLPPIMNGESTNVVVEKNAFDTQVGGSHYSKLTIQPSEYSMKNNLNWCQGNVVKYITRYKDKNGLEDLKKAKHYIDLLIQTEYKCK